MQGWMKPFFNGKDNFNNPPNPHPPFHWDSAPFHWNSPPFHYDNPMKTLICSAGQSNSDIPITTMTTLMESLGIELPAYSEAPVPGVSFTNWYGSAGFAAYADGSEATQNVTSITQTGGTATLTLIDHGIGTTTMIVVAGANEAEYNGIFRSDSTTANTISFAVDSSAASPATGTITVRRAGFQEVFLQAITDIKAEGYGVYIPCFQWMQGEGNSLAATYAQYDWFNEFIAKTYEWFTTTVAAIENVYVPPNFMISVGLTALAGADRTGTYDIWELNYVRAKQKAACAHRDYAYWLDTVAMLRTDEVHIDSQTDFKTKNIEAMQQRRNITISLTEDED